MKQVTAAPSAAKALRRVRERYDSAGRQRFDFEFLRVANQLARAPKMGAVVAQYRDIGLRRRGLRRFSYSIYYIETVQEVRVVALLHDSRDLDRALRSPVEAYRRSYH